jgi:hypothetical protein
MDSPAASSLTELISYVMNRDSYSSLSQLKAHTAIPYQTLYAWHDGTRGGHPDHLRRFAEDFGLTLDSVFKAAGRVPPLVPETDWIEFELAAMLAGSDAAVVINQFIHWYLGADGSELPQRPVTG